MNRRFLVAVATLLLLASVSAAGCQVFKSSTDEKLMAARVSSEQGLNIYPAFSPDGKQIAYCSDRGGNFEIYIKSLGEGGEERQLTSDGQQNFQPTWSPDGQQLAYHSKYKGGVWLIAATGGAPRQLVDFGSRPIWSQDGANIVFQSEPLIAFGATGFTAIPPSTIWMMPSQGGMPKQLTQAGNPTGGHGSAIWSPDGQRIIFQAYNPSRRISELWSINGEGGDLKKFTHDQQYCYDPVYAPDGKSIYYSSVTENSKYSIWKMNIAPNGAAEGEPVEVKSFASAPVRQLAISRDGKRLSYVTLATTSELMSLAITANGDPAGEPQRFFVAPEYRSSRPAFSPDGKKIAFVMERATNQDIWVMDANGTNKQQLTSDPAGDSFPNWFPGGDRIAFLSNRNRRGSWTIWSNPLKNGADRLLTDIAQDIDQGRLSPDGKAIAFNSKKDGKVINVWVAPLEGGEPKQLTFDNELAGFPAWSPDGKFIAFQVKRKDSDQVAIIPSSGGTPTQLTFDKGQSWVHSWAPDNEKIVFAGSRSGFWNVWWVSRTTKEQKPLTKYKKLNAYVRYPAWSPLNDRVIYEYTETVGAVWIMGL